MERDLRDQLDQIQNLCREEEVLQLKDQLTVKERELDSIRKELHMKRRQFERLQQDLNVCHLSLQAVEKERTQLQASLNEESGVKMRLFKALSELSRRHQSYVEELQRKNMEVDHLRQRLAEIMAIVPAIPTPIHAPPPSTVNDVFESATVTPFATTTTSAAFQVTTADIPTYHTPQLPVATPLSTAAGSALFSTPPGNQQT